MAELNPSIILQGSATTNPVALQNPMDMAYKSYQNKLAQRHIQAFDEAQNKTNQLSRILKSSLTPTGEYDPVTHKKVLLQGGFADEAQAVDKAQQDAAQELRLQGQTKIENGLKTIDYGIKKAGMVRDQAGLDALRQEMESLSPGAGAAMPSVYSPEAVQSMIDMALTAKDKVLMHQQDFENQFKVQDFNYKQKNDQLNREVQMRGQDQSALNRESPPPMNVGQQYDYDKKVQADKLAKDQTIAGLQDTIDNIDKLSKLQDNTSTGPVIGSAPIASLRKSLPTKDAENLQKLEKGYAEISLKLIGSLKQGGTTLGALSEKEGQWLKDASESIQSNGAVNKEMLDRGRRLAEDQMKRLGASPGASQNTTQPQQVRTQKSKITGKRRQSTDGGMTWQIIN